MNASLLAELSAADYNVMKSRVDKPVQEGLTLVEAMVEVSKLDSSYRAAHCRGGLIDSNLWDEACFVVNLSR